MLRIVAAPLFKGRPEITITQDIVDHAQKNGIPYSFISEGIYNSPGVGAVYNDEIMARYYLRVTETIINQVQDGDDIFWIDGWNPALTSLMHYCTAKRIKVKNYGIWHSSPITPGDYLADSPWAVDFQEHLYKHMTGVFVATKYMKDMSIISNKYHPDEERFWANKIHVTGLPLDTSVFHDISAIRIRDSVVYAHRWADDKRPKEFLRLAQWWKANRPESALTFKVFSPNEKIEEKVRETWWSMDGGEHSLPVECVYNATKQDFYNNLSTCAYIWANSELETFGYSILEGVLGGATPVLNNMPCYAELYEGYTYNTFEEQVALLDKNINYSDLQHLRERLSRITAESVLNMFQIMGY